MVKRIIEVGQIWRYGSDPVLYTITKIVGRRSYSDQNVDTDPNSYFTILDENGYAYLGSTWELVRTTTNKQTTPQSNIINQTTSKNMLDFFKSVPDGYCACNILKSKCDYHG